MIVNRTFEGKPKDIAVFMALKNELETRINDVGFECSISVQVNEHGYWIPIVEITGRIDKAHQAIIDNEGLDLEQRIFEARRTSSAQLKDQGVDTDLLLG